ncbi:MULTISPECIES: oxidoreductase [unclassified Vibrio]|uniref:oxidoreductase n=1 Tax=unclassified Vibrio TaxID=2614977 RepID=UPI001F10CC1A|nr:MULTISPECIES: oxidoreductase [unclassified Vibrio]
MSTFKLFRPFIAALLCTCSALSFANENDAILTVNDHGKKAYFTLEQLLAHADQEIMTDTPWTQDNTKFVGVSAQELLKLIGRDNADLKVVALNNYWSTIPYSDIEKYNPLFAVKKDGEVMSVRDKGPIWVIYPLTDFDELNNEVLHSRMVWQVSQIETMN